MAALLPTVAMADDSWGLKTTLDATNGVLPETVAGSNNIPTIIGNVVGNGLALLGVIFFILMLYGGLTWMIAKGDTAKADKAKDIIEAAIIGLVLVLSAYAIATFVFAQIAG